MHCERGGFPFFFGMIDLWEGRDPKAKGAGGDLGKGLRCSIERVERVELRWLTLTRAFDTIADADGLAVMVLLA